MFAGLECRHNVERCGERGGGEERSDHVKDLHTIFLGWISWPSPGQGAGVDTGDRQVVTGGTQTGGLVTPTPSTGGTLGTLGLLVVFIIIVTITPVIDMFVTVRQFVFHFLTKRRQIDFID